MRSHQLHVLLSNEVALNRAVLWHDADRFRAGPDDGAVGWGFGLVQSGRVVVKRRPRLGNHVFDFAALVGDAPSRCVAGVVVADHGRTPDTDAVPPFRLNNWLLATYPSTGARIPREQRDTLRAALPDHVARTIEGESDAELVMHCLVSDLGADPAGRNADYPVEALADHLRTGAARILEHAPGAPRDAVVGNGRVLAALADTQPLFFRTVDGLSDDPIEAARRQDMHLSPRVTPRDHFRAVMVTSLAPDDASGSAGREWRTVERGQVLTYTPREGATLSAV